MACMLMNQRRHRGIYGGRESGAVGAIATGAALQLAADKSSSLKEMASALHDVIDQFTDENLPSHVQVCADGRSMKLEIEPLRDCSVDEILEQLRPLFEDLQAGDAI